MGLRRLEPRLSSAVSRLRHFPSPPSPSNLAVVIGNYLIGDVPPGLYPEDLDGRAELYTLARPQALTLQ